MTAAAKEHDARYAEFVARMLKAESEEFASVAKMNERMTLHTPATIDNSATVRPSK